MNRRSSGPMGSGLKGLRIGIVKPDYGVAGGFERSLEALGDQLAERGHRVETVGVPAKVRPRSAFGYEVAPVFREWHDEYFRYLELTEATQRLNLDRFDVVCSTQPPTYAAPHARRFSLTYHQYRVFYDLADEFVKAGFVTPEAHHAATAAVRQIDAEAIAGVRGFLAGSETVAERLQSFWNVGSVVYRVPNVTELPSPTDRDASGTHVLCVSRQEWPKRTELFVAAMHLTAARRAGATTVGHLVGGGSRLDFVTSLDIELGNDLSILETIRNPEDAGILWQNMGIFTKGWIPAEGEPSGRIHIHGEVSDTDRNRLYQDCACVVAPAFDEDYGLTVLEAWQQRRPVVVCSDGGGLAEFVTHGVNGLVAEPTPFAIAQAIDRLCNDPALGDRLVQGGLESLSQITWTKAVDTFESMALMAAGSPEPSAAPAPPMVAATPASPDLLARYASTGVTTVSGWNGPAVIDLLIRLSAAQDHGGHTAEIGIHHGQMFILLALLCAPGERAVGFDLFENQDENVDGSGLGDREQLDENLRAAQVPESRVVLATQNSLRLDPADVLRMAGGRIRLFSVDGGHTAVITANDLWIADRTLTTGGIVVLDDAFNTMWPGVGEGMHNYLRHHSSTLIPFGSIDNKTLFTNSAAHAETYRTVLGTTFPGYLTREDEMYGSPMVCSALAPNR